MLAEFNTPVSMKHINRHDRYMKSMLTNKAVAQDYFQGTLPPQLLEQIDLDSLVLQEDSYLDDKLALRICDLLYKVDFKDPQASVAPHAFLWLLLEHASTPQRFLPLRIWEYMTKIWMSYVKHHKQVKVLPPIYPQIIYNGQKKYNYPLNFLDLFGDHKRLMEKILNNPIDLLDLSQVSDDDLQRFNHFYLSSMVAKHIHDPDLLPLFKGYLVQIFQALEKRGEVEMIYATMHYVYHMGSVSDPDQLLDVLEDHLGSETTEGIMRIADVLLNKGQEMGKAIGQEIGIKIGWEDSEAHWRKEQQRQMIHTMLENGATLEMIGKFLGISEDEVRQYTQ